MFVNTRSFLRLALDYAHMKYVVLNLELKFKSFMAKLPTWKKYDFVAGGGLIQEKVPQNQFNGIFHILPRYSTRGKMDYL